MICSGTDVPGHCLMTDRFLVFAGATLLLRPRQAGGNGRNNERSMS